MFHKISNVLYHGAVSEILKIDVSAGRGRKDFGKGFYMSVTKRQAIGMMHKKYRETIRRNPGNADYKEYLYEIHLNEKIIDSLNIKFFEEADMEWLDFVLMCRSCIETPHNFDIVIGPTADDDTALCLKAYRDGLYGNIRTEEAKQILLNNLEVENLGIQYFIGKQEVADTLIKDMKLIDWR